MEINLGNNGIGNVGIGREALGTTGVGTGGTTVDATRSSRSMSVHVSKNSASDIMSAGLASAEPVADVPEAELSRDDALGKLVNSAFSLPAPPMPSFAD